CQTCSFDLFFNSHSFDSFIDRLQTHVYHEFESSKVDEFIKDYSSSVITRNNNQVQFDDRSVIDIGKVIPDSPVKPFTNENNTPLKAIPHNSAYGLNSNKQRTPSPLKIVYTETDKLIIED